MIQGTRICVSQCRAHISHIAGHMYPTVQGTRIQQYRVYVCVSHSTVVHVSYSTGHMYPTVWGTQYGVHIPNSTGYVYLTVLGTYRVHVSHCGIHIPLYCEIHVPITLGYTYPIQWDTSSTVRYM